jgi:hypothetical protein
VVEVVDVIAGVEVLEVVDDVEELEDVEGIPSHSSIRSITVRQSDDPGRRAPGFTAETMQGARVGEIPSSIGDRWRSSAMRAVPSSESDVHEPAVITEAATTT